MNRWTPWLRILAYSGLTGMAAKIVQFLAFTVLALTLAPIEFGRFAIAQIVVIGVVSILGSSYSIAANRLAADLAGSGPSRTIAAKSSVVALRRHLVPAMACSVLAIPMIYAVLSPDGFRAWTIPWAVLASTSIVVDTGVGALAGAGAVRKSGLLDALRVASAGIFALVLGIAAGFEGAVFGFVIVDAVIGTGVLIAVRASSLKLPSTQLLAPTIVAGLTSNTVSQGSLWLLTWGIQNYYGLVIVATFSIANRFASLVLVAPGLISRNSLGMLARERNRGEKLAMRRELRAYVVLVAGLALGAAIVVLVAVPSVFHDLPLKYPALWSMLWILLFFAVVRAVATSLGVVCAAWGRLRAWVASDVIAALCSMLWTTFAMVTERSVEFFLVGLVVGAAVCLVLRAYTVRMETNSAGAVSEP